ncbi:MAG: hypothetical protein AAFQ41_00375 [Cyanobacteria bacterium J06623_7]
MFDLWFYINPIHHPSDGNLNKPPEFDLGRHLHRVEISRYGLKRSVTFYAEYSQSEGYSIPLCTISWRTVFDGVVPKTQIKRTSLLKDGTWEIIGEQTLVIEKPKLFLQKMRSRVIEELIDLADKFGLGTKLKALYEEHATEIYIYKEGGSPIFRSAIANSQEEWLKLPSTDGRTVRDVIVDYLSIGVAESEVN